MQFEVLSSFPFTNLQQKQDSTAKVLEIPLSSVISLTEYILQPYDVNNDNMWYIIDSRIIKVWYSFYSVQCINM